MFFFKMAYLPLGCWYHRSGPTSKCFASDTRVSSKLENVLELITRTPHGELGEKGMNSVFPSILSGRVSHRQPLRGSLKALVLKWAPKLMQWWSQLVP